jgi:hypothetical protein
LPGCSRCACCRVGWRPGVGGFSASIVSRLPYLFLRWRRSGSDRGVEGVENAAKRLHRIAQGLQPWVSRNRKRPESIFNPLSGCNSGGRASSRAGKTCQVARNNFIARSKEHVRLREPSRGRGTGTRSLPRMRPRSSRVGCASQVAAEYGAPRIRRVKSPWYQQIDLTCRSSMPNRRAPLSGRVLESANPGLKRWAILCSRFAAILYPTNLS